MRIDTNTETFDIQKIQNRRFMYNPQTGTLILGIQTQCNDFFYKKVTEYRRIGIRSNFNEFVSGWVGSGKTGVIDFTPSVPTAAKSRLSEWQKHKQQKRLKNRSRQGLLYRR